MTQVLFTEKQITRAERNKGILGEFKSLRKKNPDISLERIFSTIAQNYDISSAAVRMVCKRAGVLC